MRRKAGHRRRNRHDPRPYVVVGRFEPRKRPVDVEWLLEVLTLKAQAAGWEPFVAEDRGNQVSPWSGAAALSRPLQAEVRVEDWQPSDEHDAGGWHQDAEENPEPFAILTWASAAPTEFRGGWRGDAYKGAIVTAEPFEIVAIDKSVVHRRPAKAQTCERLFFRMYAKPKADVWLPQFSLPAQED